MTQEDFEPECTNCGETLERCSHCADLICLVCDDEDDCLDNEGL